MTYQILTGDCRTMLDTLPANSVHCVVTSPPYFGLRDYGHDGQIGLEQSPNEYVAQLVDVFRKVRRVLRDDGTVFLNLGDSYYNYRPGGVSQPKQTLANHNGAVVETSAKRNTVFEGIKEKDLIGIPWRVAFALQADGWWLRSDIIWHKPNPMPESVTDRPTKAHEYIFLLTKSERYFYDAEAVKEAQTESTIERAKYGWNGRTDDHSNGARTGSSFRNMAANGAPMGENKLIPADGRRNRRSVWTITPAQFREAHFATYPPEIPELCILAGTSAHGCCAACGAPWRRVVERTDEPDASAKGSYFDKGKTGVNGNGRVQAGARCVKVAAGWQPSCTCGVYHGDDGSIAYPDPVPCSVLDPFAGSGTTLAVAQSLGRDSIGIELNPVYVELAHRRIGGTQPAMFGIGA